VVINNGKITCQPTNDQKLNAPTSGQVDFLVRRFVEGIMKVWVSKYALSSGILEKEMERASTSPEYVTDKYLFLKLGSEAHESKEEAIKKANDMRIKKIASLRKKLEKIEGLVFGA
jgi:hypothetical protein